MVLSFAEQLFAASRASAATGYRAAGLALRSSTFRLSLLAGLLVLPVCSGAYAQGQPDVDAESASPTGVAGEILDTAIEHCRNGEGAEALALFRAMRDQLDPPPAILRLIQDLEATGCIQPQIASSGFRLQLGGGWDSNVTQGISARTLVVGSGANAIELELDQSYRPRSSPFAQVALDYSLVLPASGLNLQASAGHRKNTRASAFDLSTASVGGSRDFKVRESIVRAQLELAEAWLGQRDYQRTVGAGLQWLRATALGSWLGSLTAIRVDYLTQPSQNALQTEAGLLLERRLSAVTSAYGGFSLQHDQATNVRPGGDRQGFQVQVGATILASGWRFRPQLSYTQWASADVFAAGLLDVRRRNRLSQAVFQAEKPLSPRSSLVLEWRGRWAQDTVALYRYNAQTLTATLIRRF